jgi:hypothetical protein
MRKPVFGDQILPDGHGIAPARQAQLNDFAVGFTDAERTAAGSTGMQDGVRDRGIRRTFFSWPGFF